MNEPPDPGTPPRTGPIGIDVGSLANVVDSGPFGLIITDRLGVIRWTNSTIGRWLDLPASDLVDQRTFQDLLAPGGRIYYDTHVRPLLHMSGQVSEIALELVRSDGSRLAVLINSQLRAGDDDFVDIVVFDATHRRSYEDELLRSSRRAEASEARLQLMYDIASGLATAITVEDIVAVVTERSRASFGGAQCSLWMFEHDRRAAVRVGAGGTDRLSKVDLPTTAPALDLLEAGDLVVIPDCAASPVHYPLLCEWLTRSGIASAVIAPLVLGGELGGVISYGFSEAHQFTPDELRATSALASQTEQAVLRAQLVDAELRSKDRLQSLLDFTAQLSGGLTLDDVIDTVTEGSETFLGAIGVRVALLDDDGRHAKFVRGVGIGGRLGVEVPIDAPSIGCAAIRTGDIQTVGDRVELEHRFPDSPILSDPDFGHVVGVPLRRGDTVLGAWVLAFRDTGTLDLDDLTIIELFAAQAAHATQRAALHDAENQARVQADLRRLMSEALNRAVTTSEVGRAITHEGRKAFGASGLALFVVDAHNPALLVAESSIGLDPTDVASSTPIEDLPLGADLPTWSSPLFVTDPASMGVALDGLVEGAGWPSAAVLPLGLSGRLLGVIVVGFDRPDALDSSLRVALTGLSAEASVALGRAHRFDVHHDIAITLQRSLLPDVTSLSGGWEVSTWYEPGSDLLVVGGDMFDVTELDDGRIVLVVGDVVGHGLDAAASMGLLRSAAKALALVTSRPADVISGLRAFASFTEGVRYSSICCVDVAPDGTARYSSAGHPYPVLRHADGRTELLDGARSPLLGIGTAEPGEATFDMTDGSTLVVYTDGLVDRRDCPTDDEVARLRAILTSASFPATTAQDVVAKMIGNQPTQDDTVVVCLSKTR